MPRPTTEVILRIGNPWLMLPVVLIVLALPLAVLSISILGAVVTTYFVARLTGIAVAAMMILLLVLVIRPLIVILVRNPQILRRSVAVTDETVHVPARSDWVVPIPEIAGIGLAYGSGGLVGGRSWGLMIWRVDGRQVWSQSLSFVSEHGNPGRTMVGIAASKLYGIIASSQGPQGALATRTGQTNLGAQPSPSPSSDRGFTSLWDPVTRKTYDLSPKRS
jgi:hypothetical protein